MNRILKAALYAKKHHAGQTRKYNGDPYINHPGRVAARVILLLDELAEYIGVYEVWEDLVIAAWCHDLIEDTDVTREDLEREFGTNVANLVCELTNPSKGVKANRAARKQMDRDHLKVVSVLAKIIKLIDRIDNLKELSDPDFALLYSKESLLLVDAIKENETNEIVLKLAEEAVTTAHRLKMWADVEMEH